MLYAAIAIRILRMGYLVNPAQVACEACEYNYAEAEMLLYSQVTIGTNPLSLWKPMFAARIGN